MNDDLNTRGIDFDGIPLAESFGPKMSTEEMLRAWNMAPDDPRAPAKIAIGHLQQELRKVDPSLFVDGCWGPHTQNALRAFRARFGHNPDFYTEHLRMPL